MSPDPRVYAYIANAADFAHPIRREIRQRVVARGQATQLEASEALT